ncbi:MAG TPA: hypothetical protein VMI54_15310 [Polyangiaceae bacterium]|nr:hypothetical protein [Polyangiaceae bacterium]
MPDAVVVTCPRCGAGVERGWNALQAQCRYCGTLVELPQVPPPPPQIPYQPIAYPPVKPNYVGLFVSLGVTALVVLISVGATFWQAWSTSGKTITPGAAVAVATAGIHVPEGTELVAINAPNMKALDPTSLVQQAAAAVRQRDSQCELTYAYIGEFSGPGLDATGSASLLNFTCHSVDKTKPPGQDVSDNQWDVRVLQGHLTLEKSAFGTHKTPPWREPACPFSQAWAAAVASGLPGNALATVYYEKDAWSLRVNGHTELDRLVNGATCKVVRGH